MQFPYNRNRRLRQNDAIRQLVAENRLHINDFIVPIFIAEGSNKKEEIPSMPGYFRHTLDLALREIESIHQQGVKAILLFVKVADELKDNEGKEALNPNGLMQRAISAIKSEFPELIVMTDVAFDPYSKYGHDGIVVDQKIDNDSTLALLGTMALSHANAGADFVAPSDMMDGRIAYIRENLEENDFVNTGIMAYSAKYASAFYGPFRDALESAPGFGDKKTYQMDPANVKEGVKEAIMDVDEGADIVMVKPALAYLDVIKAVKESVSVPVAAYQVSGEYAMIKAATQAGWLDENQIIIESLMGIKRAGADLIATYFIKELLGFFNE